MTLQIRRARPDDAAELAALAHRVWAETYFAGNPGEEGSQYMAAEFNERAMRSLIDDPDVILLTAEAGGQIIGLAHLVANRPEPGVRGANPIELLRLYVDTSWHGRGAGASLLRSCVTHATERGHGSIWLSVWVHNARARAFYRKWDFEDVGMLHFVLGDEKHENRVLERRLQAPPMR